MKGPSAAAGPYTFVPWRRCNVAVAHANMQADGVPGVRSEFDDGSSRRDTCVALRKATIAWARRRSIKRFCWPTLIRIEVHGGKIRGPVKFPMSGYEILC